MGFAYETLGSIEAADWSLFFYRVGGIYVGAGGLALSALGSVAGATKFRQWWGAREQKRPASAIIRERIREPDPNFLEGMEDRIGSQRERIIAFKVMQQTFDQPGFSEHNDIEFQGMYTELPPTPPEPTQQ